MAGRLTRTLARRARVKHSSSGYGAIAQLGERVLCKHEVVGSIPSGSTTLRLRLCVAQPGMSDRSVPGEARKSEDGPAVDREHRPRNITSHVASFTGCACGISDIVKRRLVRVWDLRSNSQVAITISGTFRRSFIAR